MDDEGAQRGLVEWALLVILAVYFGVPETLRVELGGLDVDLGDGDQSREPVDPGEGVIEAAPQAGREPAGRASAVGEAGLAET